MTLRGLLGRTNTVVRLKATECLKHAAAHAVGRTAVLQSGLLPPLAKLFGDGVEAVRENVHMCLERLSMTEEGARALVDEGFVPQLVERLGAESAPMKELVLDELHNCMKVDTAVPLRCGAMQAFTALLGHPAAGTAARAARNVMDLSLPLAGKEQACDLGAVAALIALLRAPDGAPEVKMAACAALMSITITTRAKRMALEGGVVAALPPLLSTAHEPLLLNAIKLITTMAEAPDARAAFQGVVPRLVELKAFDGGRLDRLAVARSSQTAIDTITWRP